MKITRRIAEEIVERMNVKAIEICQANGWHGFNASMVPGNSAYVEVVIHEKEGQRPRRLQVKVSEPF